MGEPGVGKSRLFHEFKLVSQKGCLVLETFSVSHGKAYAYLPLIELLKHYFQITLHDDERKMREKIAGKVLVLDRSLEETLPYLFFLLGIAEPTSSLHQMDPQIRRKRTFEAIKRLLVRESLNQPLGQAEAEELLTVLLGEQGGATHASPLRQFILAKTEGNPFFMEEIVQDLFEQKVLVRDVSRVGTAHPTPTGALPESFTDLHLPPTVQGVLTARIDRLPLEEKALLQTLTVMGKEFPFSLLKHVVNQSEDKLQPLLFHLQEAEFIYEQEAEKVGWAVPTKKSVLPRQGRWAVPTLPWRPKQRIIFSV
jgi:predicted ATPase